MVIKNDHRRCALAPALFLPPPLRAGSPEPLAHQRFSHMPIDLSRTAICVSACACVKEGVENTSVSKKFGPTPAWSDPPRQRDPTPAWENVTPA